MSYPQSSAVVGVRMNLDAYDESDQIAQEVHKQLQLLLTWEQTQTKPLDGLGMLMVPVMVGNETVYAQLPLSIIPPEYLPDIQRVFAIFVDCYVARRSRALQALLQAAAQLQGEENDRNADQAAVPAQEGHQANQ